MIALRSGQQGEESSKAKATAKKALIAEWEGKNHIAKKGAQEPEVSQQNPTMIEEKAGVGSSPKR